jgi:predicted dinucleotide-binding enzyme
MVIGMLGNGTMASALAEAWTREGHTVLLSGRSADKAQEVAERLGECVEAVPAPAAVERADVVVVAVAWEGIDNILTLAGAATGAFAGKTIIDCTNAVDYASGKLKPEHGSAAEHIAERAPGGHVVKALHLFAGTGWLSPSPSQPVRTVAICGDHPAALDEAAMLIRDLGGAPAVIGGLDHARQLEDVAGFVMQLVAAGSNPVTAVPYVEPSVGHVGGGSAELRSV